MNKKMLVIVTAVVAILLFGAISDFTLLYKPSNAEAEIEPTPTSTPALPPTPASVPKLTPALAPMTVAAEKRYGLSNMRFVYVGGDGASWVEEGARWLGASRVKLDAFHVHRLLGRAFGFSHFTSSVAGQLLDGHDQSAIGALTKKAVDEPDNKKREKMAQAIAWVMTHHGSMEKIVYPSLLRDGLLKRQLGTMERHVDLVVAERFKKRGMSWTLNGAHHLLTLRVKKLNKEWPVDWRLPAREFEPVVEEHRKPKNRVPLPVHQAGMPILDSGKPKVRALKQFVLGGSFAKG